MTMNVDHDPANNWQAWMLGIVAVVMAGGIIGLTTTLIGLREDLAVVKRDVQYLTTQGAEAQVFRTNLETKLSGIELRIQRLEDRDHTEVRR